MEAEIARLRAAPAQPTGLPEGLEKRLSRLELAASGNAIGLWLDSLRARARAVLGPEMAELDRTLAAQTFPNDVAKRFALEAQLLQAQLTRATRPRPRTRRKPTNH